MNFLKVRAEHASAKSVVIAGPDFPIPACQPGENQIVDVAPGAELTLGLRPEHIQVCEPGTGASTLLIEVVENLGDLTFLHGTTPGRQSNHLEREGISKLPIR